MNDVKCPVCGAPATLEESGWCFCQNTACMCAWSVMCTDKIAAVTAERDSWRQVHKTALDHAEEREKHHAETVARLTAERDSLKHAVEQAERALMEIGACSCEIGTDVERLVHAHRCALLAKEQATDKLTALKKRVVDAPRLTRYPSDDPNENIRIALLRLEDGEA